jgi:ATP-binding cassette, subfamily B, bacterial
VIPAHIRAFTRHYAGKRGKLAAATLLSVLGAAAVLPIPLLVGMALDDAILDEDIRQLALLSGAVVALSIVSGLIRVLATRLSVSATSAALASARAEAVQRLLELPRPVYAGGESAQLHDQVVHETQRIEEGTNAVLNDFLPGAVLAVGIAAVLAVMNPFLMIVTVVWGPVIYVAGKYLGRWVDRRIEGRHRTFERFSRSILGLLRSMDLVRIQGAEDYEARRQGEDIDDLARSTYSTAVGIAVYSVTQETLLAVSGAAVLVAGGFSIVDGSMTVGDLISFFAGLAILRGPLAYLSSQAHVVIEGARSLRHLHELVDAGDDRPYTGSRSIDFSGAVRLEDVTFGYGATPVVEDVSLELRPGKVVGIAGPNGSGKTTIVSLIIGFYRPGSGSVSADGVPYDEIDLPALRTSFGIVPQLPVLLSESVAGNILYGREGFSQSDVWRALEVAGATEFVQELPEGLQTRVGEDGVFLSGGQRQRLAIARAVLHRPPLLVLDEPTNHLDRQAIGHVFRRIAAMRPRPSILVISHNTEILHGVDELIELKDGRVANRRFDT